MTSLWIPLWLSLKVAGWATLFACVLGIGVAYALSRWQSRCSAAPPSTEVSAVALVPKEERQGHIDQAKSDELTASRGAAPTAVIFDEDGVMGKAYDARTTPHMYVIDKAGVLQYMGGIDSIPSAKVEDIAKATPYFANAATAVLAGQAPDPAVTRPYGCGVKY